MQLKDKVAIVTGADSGIGAETATLFAQAGAHVVITYNTDKDGAERTAQRVREVGRLAMTLQTDVGSPAAVTALFERAGEYGPPDILVANAGQAMSGMPVADMEDARLEQILRVDLMAPLFCARAFIQARRAAAASGKATGPDGTPGGRIVFTGSVAGHLPTPGSAPYGMAKAGLNSLVRSLSVELAPDRINVNAVAPGLIDTPMTADRLQDPEKRARSMESIPWRRPGRPEEIAALILFLASDAADYMTGQTVTMDGGLTMNWGGA